MAATALSEHERTLLSELTKHPGWAVLRKTVEENAERKALATAKLLLHTLEPLNQEQLFYDRGYWQAMTDLIAKPERAAKQTGVVSDGVPDQRA